MTDGQSDGAKSDGATERRSDRWTERRSEEQRSDRATKRRSDGAMERLRNGALEQISGGGTERRSDSNKTKISRLLNSYRKIYDSRDLEQGFSNAPTVGVLENYQ